MKPIRSAIAVVALVATTLPARAQQPVDDKLKGFDEYMAQVLKDWNVPGIGVGIVVKGKLVFAKGYGYRDYGKKLPYTPTTVQPIASNTKLFTATAVGMLVDEGKLDWDKPIRNYVPSLTFYDDYLDRTITVRDMLSHRTGITRHDLMWYKSDFTQKELFERVKYLEPAQPPRTIFLYNNLMYTASGYSVEVLSGKPWQQFVTERILQPLDMKSTTFTIEDTPRRRCGVARSRRRAARGEGPSRAADQRLTPVRPPRKVAPDARRQEGRGRDARIQRCRDARTHPP